MADWIRKLDACLTFNERNILTNAGKVSARLAEEHAASEFKKYDHARLSREASEPTSDFDMIVAKSRTLKPKDAPKPARKPRKKDA
jgi:hypothetical protein